MTLKSDTHDDVEEAMNEAKRVLGSVFETIYSPTHSPVHHADTEQSEWYFTWEFEGDKYRFGIDLWSGSWWLHRGPSGDRERLLYNT